MAAGEPKGEAKEVSRPEKPTQHDHTTGFPPSPSVLPSPSDWDTILKLSVQDAEGKQHPLDSLVQPDDETDTVLLIFVRHFFCGLCQNYIESLSPLITPETLKAHRTRLILIGCGAYGMIKGYAKVSETTFPVYTDHSREIYKALGMIRTLQRPAKLPTYVRTGVLEMGVKALKHGIKSVLHGGALWEAGDISQVGGEWFVRNKRLVWGHRMPHTAGHMTAEEIWEVVKFREDGAGDTLVKEGIIRAGTMDVDKNGALPTENTPSAEACGCK